MNIYKLYQQILEAEKTKFEEFYPKLEEYFAKYFEVSTKRKEKSSPPLPEKNGNYYYYSKHSAFEDNDYEVVYRKKMRSVLIQF